MSGALCAYCGNGIDLGRHLCPSCEDDAEEAVEGCTDLEDAFDRCTNPGGHVWNRSAAEADELNLQGINAGIRCVYCGADGDA